jgi:hypothetical protein
MPFSAESCQKSVLKQKHFVDYVPRTVLIFPWSVVYTNKQVGGMHRFIFWDAEHGWVAASASAANWKFLDPRGSTPSFCVITRTGNRDSMYERIIAGRGLSLEQRAWYNAQEGIMISALTRINSAPAHEERLDAIASSPMPEAPAWMLERENLAKSLAREPEAATYARHSPQWVRRSTDSQTSEPFVAWEKSKYQRKTGEVEFVFKRANKTTCKLRHYPVKAAVLERELNAHAGKPFRLSRFVTYARGTGKVVRVHAVNVIEAE